MHGLILSPEDVADQTGWILRNIKTFDEHDSEMPHKSFPDLPHLKTLFSWFADPKPQLIVKSRQMMATWAELAWLVSIQVKYSSLMPCIYVTYNQGNVSYIKHRLAFILSYLSRWENNNITLAEGIQIVSSSKLLPAYVADASIIIADEMAFFGDGDWWTLIEERVSTLEVKFIGVSTASHKNSLFNKLFAANDDRFLRQTLHASQWIDAMQKFESVRSHYSPYDWSREVDCKIPSIQK